MRVVAGFSWPSHKAMTVMSTPTWRRFIAAVCLRVCGVIFLAVMDGQAGAAMLAYLPVRWATASLDIGLPLRVQNNGAVPGVWRSASHSVRIPAVGVVSGVHRSLRPLPRQ
jgi:hypothetical protein